MTKKQICLHPFRSIEIYDNGETSCCWCPYLVSKYSFGNIFEQNFDEIWNGEKAKKFRQDVLDGKYSFCDLTMCSTDGNLAYYTENPEEVSVEAEYPHTVNFAIDHSCNLKCMMCRDDVECNKQETVDKLNSLIEKKFIPMLKNAKLLHPCSLGEIFVSRHSQKLVKEALQKYPSLKLCLYTNGIFCDEEHFKQLNLFGRIEELLISIHAATEKTYSKIVRGGNFEKVIKNTKWAVSQVKSGNIDKVTLNYVVNSLNYQEMPAFAKFAIDLDVCASFWEVRNWQTSEMSKNVSPYAVFEENHPEHENFLKIMKNPIFLDKHIVLNDILKKFCYQ